ncbi:hypothetical protein ACFLQN_01515 [Candidatus Aenigmatarchaeota archaeon]
MIDPHVHCRDGNQSYKETIMHVFSVADKQGVKKIFDMPNTDPPITTKADVIKRLGLVPINRKNDYFLYIGATSDEKQLEDAVKCHDEYNEIIGIKLFAGRSVGNLTVTEKEDQFNIYKTLSEIGYKGVLAVHCEKEEFINDTKWDPINPSTHCVARPKLAEIESIKDQIELVKRTGFSGNLHVCHVSCPETIEIIDKAREEMKITCGVTPHHILWNNNLLEG